MPLTVCDEWTASAFAPFDQDDRRYRIGFANLTERMPFALQVRLGLEQAAAAQKNIELLIRDNDLDRRRALENVDWFIGQDVDLVIEFQIDAEAGNIIMDRFRQAEIPVIAVDIPLPGAIFFGADNYRAGYLAGEGLGRWIQAHWGGSFDLLLGLVDARAGITPAARLQGGRDGLEAVLGATPNDRVMTLPCPTLMHEAEAMMCDQLTLLPRTARIAMLAPNDDVALGALAAFEAAGRLDQVAAVGQNADRLGRAALQRTGFPFVGSTSYAPEGYGSRLIDLALKILRGEPVPPAVYIEHTLYLGMISSPNTTLICTRAALHSKAGQSTYERCQGLTHRRCCLTCAASAAVFRAFLRWIMWTSTCDRAKCMPWWVRTARANQR